jgi:hypothetical protein
MRTRTKGLFSAVKTGQGNREAGVRGFVKMRWTAQRTHRRQRHSRRSPLDDRRVQLVPPGKVLLAGFFSTLRCDPDMTAGLTLPLQMIRARPPKSTHNNVRFPALRAFLIDAYFWF